MAINNDNRKKDLEVTIYKYDLNNVDKYIIL